MMQALRAVEQEGLNGGASDITISLPPEAAMYLLNNKRQSLYDIESRYGMKIRVVGGKVVGQVEMKITETASMVTPNNIGGTVSLGKDEQPARSRLSRSARLPKSLDDVSDGSNQEVIKEVEITAAALGEQVGIQADGDDGKANLSRSRPRRRGRRGGRRRAPGPPGTKGYNYRGVNRRYSNSIANVNDSSILLKSSFISKITFLVSNLFRP